MTPRQSPWLGGVPQLSQRHLTAVKRSPASSWNALRALLLVIISCIVYLTDSTLQISMAMRHLNIGWADFVSPYTQVNIINTAKQFPKFTPKLLVFDGGKFEVFGMAHRDTLYFEDMKYTYRYANEIPLLVRALKAHFPGRFLPGQPVFEMLFTDADSSNSECEDSHECKTSTFAPIALFGTTPKDETVFQTLRSFPHARFIECLYEYKINGRDHCVWSGGEVNKDVPWDDLIDTIIWRGSDYPFLDYHKMFREEGPYMALRYFGYKWNKNTTTRTEILHELTTTMNSDFGPRWKAVLQSVLAEGDGETPWIDTRFVGGQNSELHAKLKEKDIRVLGERMDPYTMSNYKYQIDLGGGGGTTWEGTVAKLRMPGVLFHHETPNMDWYYGLMTPWKHYVPVKTDLSDLKEKWILAQNNPEKMKKISQAATVLGDYILSKMYMDEVYQEHFVHYLHQLVKGYTPQGPWDLLKKRYEEQGYDLYSVAVCDNEMYCNMQCRKDVIEKIPLRNLDACPEDLHLFDENTLQQHHQQQQTQKEQEQTPEEQTRQQQTQQESSPMLRESVKRNLPQKQTEPQLRNKNRHNPLQQQGVRDDGVGSDSVAEHHIMASYPHFASPESSRRSQSPPLSSYKNNSNTNIPHQTSLRNAVVNNNNDENININKYKYQLGSAEGGNVRVGLPSSRSAQIFSKTP